MQNEFWKIYYLQKHSFTHHTEEQWEKDLEAELQDYEVVNDAKQSSNNDWEKDVDDLLGDGDDLK